MRGPSTRCHAAAIFDVFVTRAQAQDTTKNPEISDDSIPSRTSSKTSLGLIRDGLRDEKKSLIDCQGRFCDVLCAHGNVETTRDIQANVVSGSTVRPKAQ